LNSSDFGYERNISEPKLKTIQLTVSPGEITYGYEAKAGAPLSRVILTDAGVLQRLTWDSSSRSWKTFYSAPRDACDAYARCGAFGLCDAGAASTSFCGCVVTVLLEVEEEHTGDWHRTICAFSVSLSLNKSNRLHGLK
jgi:hypothetical protein